MAMAKITKISKDESADDRLAETAMSQKCDEIINILRRNPNKIPLARQIAMRINTAAEIELNEDGKRDAWRQSPSK